MNERLSGASSLALALAIAGAVTGTAVGAARAQTAAERTSRGATLTVLNPDSALAVTLERLPGETLPLENAVRESLQRDTLVQTARAELAAACGTERRERGDFSPELFGEAEHARDNQPSAAFFSGAEVLETDRTRLGAGARVRLPLGTELSASLNTTRVVTNSAFTLLSPQYDAYGQLELVQPLLKGFGPAARGERDAASYTREQAEASLADARLAARADVEATYWSLYAAERDYAVQSLIEDQAEAFLAEVRLRAGAGLSGPSEVANAEVFLAGQQQQVLDAEEMLDSLSDRLAVLMGRWPTNAETRFRPADRPISRYPPMDRETVVQLALARSPRMAAGERAVAAARARARGASWDALPQLDLIGTLGGRGLAGTGQEIILDFGEGPPDTVRNSSDSGLGTSVEQVLEHRYPTWSVGMRFVLPLGGGKDAGERDRLEAEVVRAEQALEAIRRDLDAEVRAQHRELERGRLRLEIAERGVRASLEQVRIGGLRFDSGRTTAFEIVRLAADLAEAQRIYSVALVRTAQAAAALRRLTGGAYPGEPSAADLLEESSP